jgi:hypothetical protein
VLTACLCCSEAVGSCVYACASKNVCLMLAVTTRLSAAGSSQTAADRRSTDRNCAPNCCRSQRLCAPCSASHSSSARAESATKTAAQALRRRLCDLLPLLTLVSFSCTVETDALDATDECDFDAASSAEFVAGVLSDLLMRRATTAVRPTAHRAICGWRPPLRVCERVQRLTCLPPQAVCL